ncbi:hypothetical protein KJ693_04850 [bacterium]|nr:hypothetical protein [bacterium]MBU1614625.1 hypothetical protein [bacterium]
MRTIELLDKPSGIDEVLKLASKENIILRTLDGREFILAEVDDFDKEIELTRQNQELMKFLEERSKETETFTLKQVRQQLT